MPRTLITGAGGFTGRHLAPLLDAHGHEVQAIVHGNTEEIVGVRYVHEVDLTDLDKLEAIIREVRPDHVVHLAAISFVAHADIEQMYRTNVVGSRQLLESLARLPRPPRSVLLASSANVYGNAREGLLDESLPPAPANDYGVTKVAMEYVASLYQEHLPLIVVRPFNYTGRGQGSEFILPKIVAHARARAPIIELGNLAVARDFSDVRVVTDAYAKLLETPAAVGGTYNICSGRAVSLHEILELVSRLSGHKLKVRVNPAFVRPNDVLTLCGSAAKIEKVIGQLISIPLEKTLSWMLDG